MTDFDKQPFAIVSLQDRGFAIPARSIQEMLIAPSVARVPGTANWVRGVLNLRGKVLPLVDLRKRLGLVSSFEEMDAFCETMRQREEDHRAWLAELEASVREERAFSLTTDPHQCRFGLWYDSYQPQNVIVKELLRSFDAPHRAIHAVAAEVEKLRGRGSDAMAAIERARGGALQRMIELFGELRRLLRESQREIAVVVDSAAGKCAVTVDSVDSVEALKEGSVSSLQDCGASAETSALTSTVGTRSENGALVLILDLPQLLAGAVG